MSLVHPDQPGASASGFLTVFVVFFRIVELVLSFLDSSCPTNVLLFVLTRAIAAVGAIECAFVKLRSCW